MVNNATPPIVEAVGLSKVFRDFWMRTKANAVDHIDFEIRPGEIFGLLGPNGSGKSTTIKMILGLLHKTSGRLVVFGKAPSDVSVKKHIGFLPEESYLYRYLNPVETLDYYGRLFGLDRATRRSRTEELLEMAEPVSADEVFRIAAPCACSDCGHFDSEQSNCRLAQKIVRWVPMVSESLPVCSIRAECRWWQQEGRAACLRCPQVVTRNKQPSEAMRDAANPELT